MIKIGAWNIQAGGGSRILSIVKILAKTKCNILVLSEFRNNDSGNTLRNYLLKAGYRFQAVTPADRNTNSIMIASSLPFDTTLHPTSDVTYGHNILSAHFGAFSILGGYFPHKKKHKLFEYANELISTTENPYIIAGDFNSGKNNIDQKGKSFWYTDQLTKLEKNNYIDAFRLVNGDVEAYSWFSHQGNGYRYDHIYLHKDLQAIVKDCYYNQEVRNQKLSDHALMILELG